MKGRVLHLGGEKDNMKGRLHKSSKKKKKKNQKARICISRVTTSTWVLETHNWGSRAILSELRESLQGSGGWVGVERKLLFGLEK